MPKTDIVPAPQRPDPSSWPDDRLTVAWLGHATVLFNFHGTWVLTDPALERRIGIGRGTAKLGPRRLVQPALRARDLPDLDLHVGTKLPRGNGETKATQGLQESLIQRDGQLRTGRVDERWPPALAGIAVESELGNHQYGAADLVQPQIHLPAGVAEEPEPGHFLGHPIYLCRRVAVGEPDQQAEASADGAGNPAIDRDRSFGDTLEYYPHTKGS